MATAVLNQITERVTKGQPNTADALTFSALSIVRVGLQSSSSDFDVVVDYRLTNGEVDWSPPGKEPTTGQSYYVTYTFQADSSFKTFDQVSGEMDVNMRALQPSASTQIGSVTRNLFIDLPANQFGNLYGAIQRVSLIQSLSNLSSFQGTELDDFGANFNVVRGGSTIASGSVTFGSSAIATALILIPAGTRVATLSTTTQGSVFFRTIEDGSIFPGQSSVTIPVEAENSGSSGNVGSGSIVILSTAILGISVVANQNPTNGGRDQESDTDFAARIRATFLANDAVTFRGIRSRALTFTNVIDALVVGAGDPLMVRGGGIGGKVDLYIQAEAGIDRAQVDTVLFSGANVVLEHQPVLSISSVFNDTTSLPITAGNYLLVTDAGDLSGSTSAQDALMVIGGASPGDTLIINYVSNGLLEDIQFFFAEDDANAVPSRDFLTRTATQVPIDVGCTVVLTSEADFGQVEAAITDAVAGYIDNLTLGAEIKYAQVFDLVKETVGVDDVRPLDLLARRGEATAATVFLARNEFPLTGTITVKQAK
jgi:uncharacterized phage protein gp47/JayE